MPQSTRGFDEPVHHVEARSSGDTGTSYLTGQPVLTGMAASRLPASGGVT
jgi:hypothetical protein